MKIYHKQRIWVGLAFLAVLAWDVSFRDGTVNWGVRAFLLYEAVYCFVFAFSKTEAARQEKIRKNYRRVSRELGGRFICWKLHLPLVVLVGFVAAMWLLRAADLLFRRGVMTTVGIAFVTLLLTSVFYSIGWNRRILLWIDDEDTEYPADGEQ